MGGPRSSHATRSSVSLVRCCLPGGGVLRLGPYRHYRRHGVAEGRQPNQLFDTRWYLERYPDVAANGMNPLDHYLRHGAQEGRDPGPDFSTLAYLDVHPDVRATGETPYSTTSITGSADHCDARGPRS